MNDVYLIKKNQLRGWATLQERLLSNHKVVINRLPSWSSMLGEKDGIYQWSINKVNKRNGKIKIYYSWQPLSQ